MATKHVVFSEPEKSPKMESRTPLWRAWRTQHCLKPSEKPWLRVFVLPNLVEFNIKKMGLHPSTHCMSQRRMVMQTIQREVAGETYFQTDVGRIESVQLYLAMKRNAVSSQADSLIEVDRMLLQEKSRADGFAFVYPPVNVHRDLESLDFLRTW